MSELIEKRNVYELVAERLMEEIASGALLPGDVLPTEKELTERYGVGRSSVREALRKLESQRVIRPTGRGAYTVGSRGDALGKSLQMMLMLGHANLEELTEFREILEVRSAGLAAIRRDDQALVGLHGALREMEMALEGSREEMLAADLKFHVAIANATGNGAIAAVSQGLRSALHSALANTYWSSADAIDQHREIAQAIADGDAGRAEQAMRRHLSWIQSILEHEKAAQANAVAPPRS